MAKLKFNINIFDVFAVIALAILICVGIAAWNNKPFLGDRNMLVEIKISNEATIQMILPEVKLAKEVFYSGTKYPVKQVSYRAENDKNGQIQYLFVVLSGKGNIASNNSIFNGQRIYVNQKVEIHADYQVQGYVADYHYEN